MGGEAPCGFAAAAGVVEHGTRRLLGSLACALLEGVYHSNSNSNPCNLLLVQGLREEAVSMDEDAKSVGRKVHKVTEHIHGADLLVEMAPVRQTYH